MSGRQRIDLLIVDDDDDFRETLVARLERHGFQVQHAADAEQALGLAQRREFDVAVFDVKMPGASGLELLKEYKRYHADCEVILLTGQGTIQSAVEAMKLGAFDYLTKPFPLKGLESLIEKAAEKRSLRKENLQLRVALQRSQPRDVMVGQSPQMQEVFRLIERAGPSEKAILIQGESGTGKELVARALHRHSQRSEQPMVVINCAALPESLLESELFGHERGAFTGATTAKPGLFEVADGGTLFIDEIGEMPPALQAKLLRVLEDGSLRRVGSIKERRVDVRLLAATNRNLDEQVRAGRFREDLFYRINVMSLELPPLRQRLEDIPLLVRHFVGRSGRWSPGRCRRSNGTIGRATCGSCTTRWSEPRSWRRAECCGSATSPAKRRTITPTRGCGRSPSRTTWPPWNGPKSSKCYGVNRATRRGRRGCWGSIAASCIGWWRNMASSRASIEPIPRAQRAAARSGQTSDQVVDASHHGHDQDDCHGRQVSREEQLARVGQVNQVGGGGQQAQPEQDQQEIADDIRAVAAPRSSAASAIRSRNLPDVLALPTDVMRELNERTSLRLQCWQVVGGCSTFWPQ